MFAGFIRSMLRRAPRYEDAQLRAFIRTYQWKCLLLGKQQATRMLDEQQESVWNGYSDSLRV